MKKTKDCKTGKFIAPLRKEKRKNQQNYIFMWKQKITVNIMLYSSE